MGEPFANSTASSIVSAFTITYPPIVSFISPKGPFVTTLLCPTTLASSKSRPLPPTNLFFAEMPAIQSIVCFIHTCICSGEATFLPSWWRKIKIYSSIFSYLLHWVYWTYFYCTSYCQDRAIFCNFCCFF